MWWQIEDGFGWSQCWRNVLDRRDGTVPVQYTMHENSNLKVIRWRTGNQWSFLRAGVMWAVRYKPRTRRAAVFWTRCKGVIVDVGRLTRIELQLSMRCKTSDVTRRSALQCSGVGTTGVDGSSRCTPPCWRVVSAAAHCPKRHRGHEQNLGIG